MASSARRAGLVACALWLSLAAGCANGGAPTEPSDGGEPTSGGETEAGATATGTTGPGSEPTLAETLQLPSTTLIPVPSSGVPRHQMSEALQGLWRQVEEASAMTPPEFEGEPTEEAVGAWTEAHFAPWAAARMSAMQAILDAARAFTASDTPEAAVAAALVGYSVEEFVIAFRGAPIPHEVAADPELLAIYVASLTEVSTPLARQAGSAYGVCARSLAPLGPESPWVEWAQYCLYRASEVNEVYRLEQ